MKEKDILLFCKKNNVDIVLSFWHGSSSITIRMRRGTLEVSRSIYIEFLVEFDDIFAKEISKMLNELNNVENTEKRYKEETDNDQN